MKKYTIYANPLDIEQKRRQKVSQMAANYVNSMPQMQIKRRLERIERQLRRLEKGLSQKEQDVMARWNARKQKRVLQQHVRLRTTQTSARKI